MEPIRDKATMYRLLAAGRLGNTIPQFFDVGEWERSADCRRWPTWGVRTLRPGGPCRLNCPREEVRATCDLPEYAAAGVNISMMIDAAMTVTLWADVYDSPAGLLVYGVEYPPKGGSWRAMMPTRGRHYEGVAAKMLLQRHLNANGLDDVEAVFDRWPGHVLELSAAERCFGVLPGRNYCTWEVRAY